MSNRRVAVVVGTSPNIGAGVALALARAGYDLVCADLDGEVAKACATAVEKAGEVDAMGLDCDVRSEADVDHLFSTATERFGGVDVAVNGAVRYCEAGLLDLPLDVWQDQLDIILTGSLLVTRAAVRTMAGLERRGSVILIGSTAGHRGQRSNIGYATAKAGLLNLVRAAAVDAASHGVRVNCVTPTGTQPSRSFERARQWGLPGASQVDQDASVAHFDAMASRLPLGELPSADDYGGAVVFLASDEARMITGSELVVDAGTLASHWVDLVRTSS